jgi:hypothetical protein
VTIAAGFVTQDGILMCADTQFTGGAKVDKRKIHPFTLNDGTVLVFALAGNPDYAHMAVEDCLEAVDTIPLAERTMLRMKRAIRDVLVSVNGLLREIIWLGGVCR